MLVAFPNSLLLLDSAPLQLPSEGTAELIQLCQNIQSWAKAGCPGLADSSLNACQCYVKCGQMLPGGIWLTMGGKHAGLSGPLR